MPILGKKTGKRGHRSATDGKGALTLPDLFKNALLALPVAMAVGLLLLLAATALLLTTPNPGQYAAIVGTALLYVCAALYGRLTVRFSRGKLPLFGGLFSGGVLLLLLLLLAWILPESATAYQRPLIVGLYAAVPCATLAGALLPARRQRAKRKRR